MEGLRTYIKKTVDTMKRPVVGTVLRVNLDRADISLPDGTVVLGAKIVGGSSSLVDGDNVPLAWSMDPSTQSVRPIVFGAGNTSIPFSTSEINGASYQPVEYGIPLANEFAKIHRDWLPIDYVETFVVFSATPPQNPSPGMFWIDTSV